GHTDSLSNHRVFPWNTLLVPRRTHDKSRWRSAHLHQRVGLISLHGRLSYQKTISLFASRAESEVENHRSLPPQRPDLDFSCLSGQTFFLLPWLQIPLHGSCPEPGLRKRLYPRYPDPEFPSPRQRQNLTQPAQGRRPPASVCRIVFVLRRAPKLRRISTPARHANRSLTSKSWQSLKRSVQSLRKS